MKLWQIYIQWSGHHRPPFMVKQTPHSPYTDPFGLTTSWVYRFHYHNILIYVSLLVEKGGKNSQKVALRR